MPSVSNNTLNRSIGGLEARMDSHDDRLKRMEEKIDVLVETVASGKGGMKTLIAASSVVAAAVAGLTQLVGWFGRH